MRLLVLMLALFLSTPALAGTRVPPEIPAVETYLKNITTLRGTFTQTAHDGAKMTGTFYLKRPGKMRFEYDAPVEDFIVADGTFIYYYDSEMKQQTNTTIGRTLADFFLRENLKLGGDIHVTKITRADNLLHMTLVQTADASAGKLTLLLSEKPLKLQGWEVVDAQGLTTKIRLANIEEGINLDRSLFYYYDPEKQSPSYNK